MNQMQRLRQHAWRLFLIGALVHLGCGSLIAEDVLQWDRVRGSVSAEVRDLPLTNLLQRIAILTDWEVYLEPGTEYTTSAKFKDLNTREALRMLLGDINFAVVPRTNGSPQLYVFRTSAKQATQQVMAQVAKNPERRGARRIANQLIVQLKPGTDINGLAQKLGAKVVGSISGLNAYLLEFSDQPAADLARELLASNEDVAAVDYNYAVSRPENAVSVGGMTVAPPNLTLKPPGSDGRVLIGVVDTGVQSFGNKLDDFVAKKLSVVGELTAGGDTPEHGTVMVWDILSSLSSATSGNTSAQIISVDVFGANGETSTFAVAEGIAKAINEGATFVNVSLGSAGASKILENLVKDAASKGIAIFAAAGNEPTGAPFYPAAYNGVTAVTALQGNQLASYANMASFVDAAAPGSSAINYGGRTYFSQGTSVASAFATGLAAGTADATGQSWSQFQSSFLNRLAVPANNR